MLVKYIIYGARSNRISEITLSYEHDIFFLENEGHKDFYRATVLEFLFKQETVVILETEYL